ncbi:MAG: TonB-dependent receptor [Bacteroidota bacterium]
MKKIRIDGDGRIPHLTKLLKVMKVTCLLLMIALVQVSASTYSQSTKLTLNLRNVALSEVFEEIERTSEFRFFYDSQEIDPLTEVSVKTKDSNIEKILNDVFYNSDVIYEIIDRYIVLKKSGDANSREKVFLRQQQKSVSGTVTDKAGEPLPGVSIIIKGTTNGTVTNMDGNYTIANLPDGATLQYSFVGMLTQEITVGTQNEINVTMAIDAIGIEEVVAVGYGTQKKINLTGAVETVSGESIKDRAVPNVAKALQGAVPNLNITVTSAGGEPGAGQNFNIRGIGSLDGNNISGSPYVVVDGVPMDINNVNPNDVASITVLKDAASSAIYGSRAPYGVILITTKTGKKGAKSEISYSTYYGLASPINQPDMTSSVNWAKSANYAADNAGASRPYTDEQLNLIEQYYNGDITYELEEVPGENKWFGDHSNNNYIDLYYDDYALAQKHDIQMSGGSENSSYFASVGYFDQDGGLREGKEGYQSYNLNLNLTTEVSDWMTVFARAKYNRRVQTYNQGFGDYNREVLFHSLTLSKPTTPLYAPDGRLFNSRLIGLRDGGVLRTERNDLMATIGGIFEPVKGWVTKVNYNWNSNSYLDVDQKRVFDIPTPDGGYQISTESGFFKETLRNNTYHMFNATTSYLKSIDNHNFYLLAGYEQEVMNLFELFGSKKDQLLPDYPSISTSTGDETLDDNISHWATQGVFGRFTYNFNEKYLFEINARYDGSSRFEEKSRWGLFPSAAVGYNIHNENFWQAIKPYVNTIKLRASYGSLGNHNVANYLYIASIPVKTKLDWIQNGTRPMYATSPNLISNSLTWETSTTLNFGADASFLKNRLSASFDIWQRNTTEMFGPAEALPAGLGVVPPKANNAELETKGFDLVVAWRDKIGEVSYNIRATLADNVSTVTKYNNPTGILSNWYEGEHIGDIWGYTSEKLFETDEEAAAYTAEIDQSKFYNRWLAGDVKYVDLDDSKKIDNGSNTVDDHGDLRIIGNNRPRYMFGLNAGLDWKGFDLNMFWQGVGKRDLYFEGGQAGFWGITTNFQQSTAFKHTEDYWTEDNTDAYYPKPYLSDENDKNRQPQTMYMRNGAYARLKSVTLGYTIPALIVSKVKISGVRIYVSGENLLTISSLNGIIDPEAISGSWGINKVYPLQRTISIGANISF